MQDSGKFNLQEYFHIFLRRKKIFLVPLLGIYLLFLGSSFFLPRIYEAKAIILVEEEQMVNPLLKNLAVSVAVSERINRLREEILSWPRLFQLVEKLGLNKNIKNPFQMERLIKDIRRNISLKLKGQDVIIISYRGKDPRATQDIINTLCDILIEKNVAAKTEEANTAIRFIKEQVEFYKKKLDTSEEKLRRFKELYALQIPLAKQIEEELAKLQADLTSALVDCTEEHPRVIELKRRIKSLKEKRRQQITEAAQQAGVDAQTYLSIAESIPRQNQELARLARDKEVNEQIYAMLLQKLEAARISQQLESTEGKTKFKIVEPARLPLEPIRPNKLQLNLLGLLLGGAVGFGSVYLAEYTGSSFHKIEDLQVFFDIPVLGSITQVVTEEEIRKRKVRRKKILLLLFSILFILGIGGVLLAKLYFDFFGN